MRDLRNSDLWSESFVCCFEKSLQLSTINPDFLARTFHESHAATADMGVLPGVLGCRTLRRTVQVRLRYNTLWLPGGKPIFKVSRLQFMKHPG